MPTRVQIDIPADNPPVTDHNNHYIPTQQFTPVVTLYPGHTTLYPGHTTPTSTPQDALPSIQAPLPPPPGTLGAAAQSAKIYNPYQKVTSVRLPEQPPPTTFENQTNSDTMGIQSQRRKGSVIKCKRMAKHRKPIARMKKGGEIAFQREEHCHLCKLYSLKKYKEAKAWHHGHHKLCPGSRENQKRLFQSGHKQTKLSFFLNPQKPGTLPGIIFPTSFNYVQETMVPMGRIERVVQLPMPDPNEIEEDDPDDLDYDVNQRISKAEDKRLNDFSSDHLEKYHSPPEEEIIDFTEDLKRELDIRMELLNPDEQYHWATKKMCPQVVSVAADYLFQQFSHRRPKTKNGTLPQTPGFTESMKNFHELFPEGTCTFKFPPDVSPMPNPWYYMISETSLIYLDWQLSFPKLELPCPRCWEKMEQGIRKFMPADARLVHTRTNFGKSQNLFPIWGADGRCTYAAIMVYECQSCKENVRANDGRLLALLPKYVSRIYPVYPRYATNGNFHLHRDLSNQFEAVMKTYANAEFFSINLAQTLSRVYVELAESYFSHPKNSGRPFPTFKEFVGNNLPPSGNSLRSVYVEAEYSHLQPYGYSNVERYTRELQSVNVGTEDCVAFDHTFQTVKSYYRSSAKAVFTGCKGSTREITSLLLVQSTKMVDVSHHLLQLTKKRDCFKPKVVYTDTIPNGIESWKSIFGQDVKCRLGLFHFMQRIVKTLESHCELFWKCLLDLKKCIYKYNEDNYNALIKALEDGTLSEDGVGYTENEIEEMKESRTWKQRYDKYLRKEFYEETDIRVQLGCWLHSWKDSCDHRGRYVFTADTFPATKEQMTKIKYILDPRDISIYIEVKAREGSKHGLSKWLSNRPESSLEKFHESLAHFANTGSGQKLADALLYRGTAEYNLMQRHKFEKRQDNLKGLLDNWMPKRLDLVPLFLDHSHLHLVNQMSVARGNQILFDKVRVPKENNGESFLFNYLEEQVARQSVNPYLTQSRNSCSLCCCDECTTRTQQHTPLTTDTVIQNSITNDSQATSSTATSIGRENAVTRVATHIVGDASNPTRVVTAAVTILNRRVDGSGQSNITDTRYPNPSTGVQTLDAAVPQNATTIVPTWGSMVPQQTFVAPYMTCNYINYTTGQFNNNVNYQAVTQRQENSLSLLKIKGIKMCCEYYPYFCNQYHAYAMKKKVSGGKVTGRPPHDYWCIKSCPHVVVRNSF